MNYGPLLFLGAFFALASSWVGFVLTPQMQVGQLQQTNVLNSSVTYPVARPGLARQGQEVYRANGCAYCHSQQIVQTGTVFDLLLTDAGTNQTALVAAIRQDLNLSEAEAKQLTTGLPKPARRGLSKEEAEGLAKTLAVGGAKLQVTIRPVGPDIGTASDNVGRGWGRRRTVAEDYLFDYPVMLGSQRIGPDLADVGSRLPDRNWHLRHLYAPRAEVNDSAMPSYRYLFEKRRIERLPSPDALSVPKELAPGAGYEIVPTPEAKALAAYLASLRVDAPLFTAPMTVATASGSNAEIQTNATGAISATNAPPAAVSGKQ